MGRLLLGKIPWRETSAAFPGVMRFSFSAQRLIQFKSAMPPSCAFLKRMQLAITHIMAVGPRDRSPIRDPIAGKNQTEFTSAVKMSSRTRPAAFRSRIAPCALRRGERADGLAPLQARDARRGRQRIAGPL